MSGAQGGNAEVAAVFTAARIAELVTPEGRPARLPTDEQARIIEQPLPGSVLVIAGAGSGKTETMANRVVWLVANGLVHPSGVLGLTFTRKAAGELNERIADRLLGFASKLSELLETGRLTAAEATRAIELQEMLGDGLELPEVSTYNAFASGIVQEFGAAAGVASAATVIDAATAWRIAREIVCRSDDRGLADRDRTIATLVSEVIDLDHAVSDNLTTFDAVEAEIAEFERAGEWSYEGNPRKQPYAGVTKAIAAVGATRLTARLARIFSAEKRRRGLIEFSDQLALAVATLGRSAEAVRTLRGRSQVVLLDEVQDTSVGQTRMLSTLFAGGSVMAVGDPHQSIYGFRGASATNLVSFHRDFADRGVAAAAEPEHGGRTLSLSVSWRNPSEVLGIANRISRPLAEALEQQPGARLSVPKLISREQYLRGVSGSGSDRGAETGPGPGAEVGAEVGAKAGEEADDKTAEQSRPPTVECRFTETIAEEFAQLADWMREARADHLARTGSLPSAAVLFRSRKRMPAVQSALLDAGVPCRIIGLGGLLATPEVTDLVAALRCLWYADAGTELIRILTGPRFGVGVADIEGLRRAARWFANRDGEMQRVDTEPDTVLPDTVLPGAVLPDPDRRVTLLDALDEIAGMTRLDRPSLAGVSEEGRVRLQEAGQSLRRLRQGVGGNLLELLRAVERELRLDIELEANESSGYAGSAVARANLDSLADLVENFLATDEQSTLASLLEWLERATEVDETAEHGPEPEPGTVQLITGHGAKGLEWDVVAIPRLVDGEFPFSSREGLGWLRPGRLPDELRGDISGRPRLDWRWLVGQAHQKTLVDALERYREQLQERHADEERRLAYVAVTRAASRLLLSGSWWGGTQKPREISVYLRELEEAELIAPLPKASEFAEDPSADSGRTLSWPIDPLGRRAPQVLRAADALRTALRERSGGAPPAARHDSPHAARHDTLIDPTVELLLAEQATALEARGGLEAPERITASTFHEFIEDPEAAERARLRPIPVRPYRRTRVGNLFHEWVERRTTTAVGTALTLPGLGTGIAAAELGEAFDDPDREIDRETYDEAAQLSELEHESGAAPRGEHDAQRSDELQSLIAQFERSRFSELQPVSVELEVNLPFAGKNLACKLDAVYRFDDTGRFEVVDWKTGAAPRNDAERASRFLQLDLYRHAYARWAGIDPALIDVTLFYVAEGVELRGESGRSFEELEAMWAGAVGTSETTDPHAEDSGSEDAAASRILID